MLINLKNAVNTTESTEIKAIKNKEVVTRWVKWSIFISSYNSVISGTPVVSTAGFRIKTPFKAKPKNPLATALLYWKLISSYINNARSARTSSRAALDQARENPHSFIGIRSGSLRNGIACFCSLLFLLVSIGHGTEPTAQELVQSVRLSQGAQHRVLKGELRCEGKVTPFRLVLNGNEIRYEFISPNQIFVLKLEDKTSHLDEITKDGIKRVTFPRFSERIRGTSVTCEDLALRFLYWPDAKFLSDDPIGGVQYYRIELHPEQGIESQYGKVVAWVAKKFEGVLGKAECYTPDGKLAVRMKVISSQTLKDGTRFLKQMDLERLHDSGSSDEDRTLLLIVGEEE